MLRDSSRLRFLGCAAVAVAALLGRPAAGSEPEVPVARVEGTAIRLLSRTFVPDAGLDPVLLGRVARPDAAPRHLFVQFHSIPDSAAVSNLAAFGVDLLAFVPDRAFIASVSGSALASLSRGEDPTGLVRWVGEITGADRADTRVASREFDDFAILPDGRVALAVTVFPDVSLDEAAARLESMGGIVVGRLRSTNVVVTEFPFESIGELLRGDVFQHAAQAGPKLSATNDGVRAATGVQSVQTAPYGLDGSGVKVLVYDAGLIGMHADLFGRVVAIEGGFLSDHATHVAGTLGGAGVVNPLYKGMAPGVQIYSAYYESCAPQCLYNNPQDIEEDYRIGHVTNGADLNSNSIGSNINPNGYPCAWEGDYETTAALVDAIVYGSLGLPVLSVWAAGNERALGARCGTYACIGIAATAKNNVVVGAFNSNDGTLTDFTSFGPTDDGRLRPDVIAPGCQSDGDRGVTSTLSSGGYGTFCGTSMATPTVSGILALALQHFRLEHPGRPDPLPATWKALLAQTATDVGAPGPNFDSGYGRVNAVALADFVSGGSFLEDAISTGSTKLFTLDVPPGTASLKVTLAWSDAAATAGAGVAIVNDLDLALEDPTGVLNFPWVLDRTNPSAPATRGLDRRNVMEQVVVDSPAAGAWRIRVAGFAVPSGSQPFSIASSLPPEATAACDVAVDSLAVDLDPGDPDVDAGPGAVGQALDVVVTVRNAGTSDVTSATIDLDVVKPDGSRVSESRTVADFSSATGSQPLGPGETSSIRFSFGAGLLVSCGNYGLEARNAGALLECGAGGPDGNARNDVLRDVADALGDPDDAYSPDLLRLRAHEITATLRPESTVISSLSEKVLVDVRLRGLSSGPGRTIRASFNLRREAGELVASDLRPPTTRTLRSNIDKTVLARFSLADVPGLPEEENLVIEIIVTEVATDGVCASALSDPFVVSTGP